MWLVAMQARGICVRFSYVLCTVYILRALALPYYLCARKPQVGVVLFSSFCEVSPRTRTFIFSFPFILYPSLLVIIHIGKESHGECNAQSKKKHTKGIDDTTKTHHTHIEVKSAQKKEKKKGVFMKNGGAFTGTRIS